MSEKFADENLDQLLRKLVTDAAGDQTAIDEIADSPQLWWGVQRRIKLTEESSSPWKRGFWGRWLIFGAPLTVAALLLVAFLSLKPGPDPVDQAVITGEEPPNSTVVSGNGTSSPEINGVETPVNIAAETQRKRFDRVKNTAVTGKSPRHQQLRAATANLRNSEQAEVKSEFIALSYARNPESGQIVRVKVPSSMMVSLGLVASVEKPTSLVNAELLIGDDGMTHAIRFIR